MRYIKSTCYIYIYICSVCVHWSTMSPSCELLWLNVLPAIKLPTIRIIRTRHYNAYNHRISYSKEVEHFSAINTWAHHRAPKFFRRRGWDHLGYREPSWHRVHLNPNDREAMWPRFPETLCEVTQATHQIIQLISQAAIGNSPTFDFSWFLHISPHISPVKILGGDVPTGWTQLADATALAL